MAFTHHDGRYLASPPVPHNGQRSPVTVAAMPLDCEPASYELGKTLLGLSSGMGFRRTATAHLGCVQTLNTDAFGTTADRIAIDRTATLRRRHRWDRREGKGE